MGPGGQSMNHKTFGNMGHPNLLPKIPEKFDGIKNAFLSNEKHDWSIRYHETHLIHVFINCLLILIFVTILPPYYSIDTRDISKPNYYFSRRPKVQVYEETCWEDSDRHSPPQGFAF